MCFKKRNIVAIAVCLLFAVSLFAGLPFTLYAEEETEPAKLTYQTELKAQEGVTDSLSWTSAYPMSGLWDGDPDTFVQIVYGGAYNPDSGKFNHSFYLDLDLGKVYDVSRLVINWYAASGRCVRYLVSASVDGEAYAPVADHRENLTVSSVLTDTFEEAVEARYIRIEIVGNYRERDDARNGYFILSELEVFGTLSDHELNQWGFLSYTAVAAAKEGADGVVSQPMLNSNYPAEHLWDGDTASLYEIQYSGEFGEDGLLKHPFTLTLDLGAVCEIRELAVSPYLGVKGVRYRVLVSEDGESYTDSFDHSGLNEIKTVTDSFAVGTKARYLQLEICGNFKSDGSHNTYTYLSEISVYGKVLPPDEAGPGEEEDPDVVKLSFSAAAAAPNGADGIVSQPFLNSVYPAEHLWDGDPATLYEIQYSGEFGEDGLLKHPFTLTMDLGRLCRLESLTVSPYLSVKGVKYKVLISKDGKTYTEAFDHTDLTEIKTVTDSFADGTEARYVQLAICGNFKADGTSNTYTYLSEIEIYGVPLENPGTSDAQSAAFLSLCVFGAAVLTICRKRSHN